MKDIIDKIELESSYLKYLPSDLRKCEFARQRWSINIYNIKFIGVERNTYNDEDSFLIYFIDNSNKVGIGNLWGMIYAGRNRWHGLQHKL